MKQPTQDLIPFATLLERLPVMAIFASDEQSFAYLWKCGEIIGQISHRGELMVSYQSAVSFLRRVSILIHENLEGDPLVTYYPN